MYVGMYVCMYACMHVCMYACMHVCMYACMHVCMYACMHLCMYACMHACIPTCMSVCMYVRMYACMYVSTHIYVNTYDPYVYTHTLYTGARTTNPSLLFFTIFCFLLHNLFLLNRRAHHEPVPSFKKKSDKKESSYRVGTGIQFRAQLASLHPF